MNKLEYIFVDLDGTLLDGKIKHYMCYSDIIKKYGGTPICIDEYWEMKRNKIKRDKLLDITDFKGRYNQFLNCWIDNIEKDEYLKYDKLKPRSKEMLELI